MGLDAKRMQKPVKKFRKLLRNMPARPSPEEVHDLRTNSRRIEAALQALSLENAPSSRQNLKRIAKVRKRAGKVRDMDVLISYVSEMPRADGERECFVDLLEYLGAQRLKYAKRLDGTRRQYAARLRKGLKQSSRKMAKALPSIPGRTSDGKAGNAEVAASALQLISDLSQPTRLGRTNLHPYRLKVKELHNVLQMAENGKQQEFVQRLGEVKDAIGEWHDWEELVAIARDALDHRSNCQLMRELRKTGDAKYERALILTESMRKKFLGVADHGKRNSQGEPLPAQPVWKATAALIA